MWREARHILKSKWEILIFFRDEYRTTRTEFCVDRDNDWVNAEWDNAFIQWLSQCRMRQCLDSVTESIQNETMPRLSDWVNTEWGNALTQWLSQCRVRQCPDSVTESRQSETMPWLSDWVNAEWDNALPQWLSQYRVRLCLDSVTESMQSETQWIEKRLPYAYIDLTRSIINIYILYIYSIFNIKTFTLRVDSVDMESYSALTDGVKSHTVLAQWTWSETPDGSSQCRVRLQDGKRGRTIFHSSGPLGV
jgi:hypothetical protein